MGIFKRKKQEDGAQNLEKKQDDLELQAELKEAEEVKEVKAEKADEKIAQEVDKKSAKVKKKETKKEPKEKESKKEAKKETKLETAKSIFVSKVLIKPWISEKSSLLSIEGKYVFKVKKNVSKGAVKDAVESLYKVLVADVNVVNVPGKPKNFKGKKVFRSDYRKAIVTLKKGEKIETV
ncbi:MAG: 50S ribosomal protein L23 [bacterium]